VKRAFAYLKLLRAGTLFSPGADVVAGLCLAGLPWSWESVRAVIASICLYAAGMVLNDHADRRRDALVRPERPIPSGQIAAGSALLLGAVLIAASLLAAPWRPYYALLAGLVLGYDYALKASAVAGALAMGALRALNLCAGAVAVTGSAPPRAVLIAAAAYGAYIIAVTLLGILEDHPRVSRRTAVSIQLVPPLCASLAMLGMPQRWPAAAIAFGLAALFAARMRTEPSWDRAAIRRSMTWLLLGTMLYTGLLCLSAGRPVECLAVLAAVPPARWVSRRIALT
jgi:4-hydroxybenzoate polyprenyltransferase